jgi:hypothetical protein
MNEYRLEWCQCPHVQFSWRVMFVQAAGPEDACAVARDHIERRYGIEWFSIRNVTLAKPVPAGAVIEVQ